MWQSLKPPAHQFAGRPVHHFHPDHQQQRPGAGHSSNGDRWFTDRLGHINFFSASGSNAATTLTASNITANTFTGTVTIPVNQTLTVSIRATAAANGAPVNQATVFAPSNASDEALTNKVSTATVVIGSGADLSATKVASTLSLELGQITTFTLTFMNSGPSAVTDATLQDILPAVMQTLSFVSSAELNGAVLISQVTTSSAFNGTSTIPVTTNLSITKTNAVTTLVAGQTTSYAITVNNNGPASADGTTVRDPVNAGLSCTSVACSASGGAICPSPPIVISTFQGAGVSLDTFSASSSMVFNLVCGVTGTGR